MIIEKHIVITDPDLSIVTTLKNELSLSSIQIKQAIQKGCLWLEKGRKIKRIRRLKTALQIDNQLHFYYNSDVLQQQPQNAELIEDNHSYSIWYKPAGMLCQGSKWGDHTTIYRFVEKHLSPERQAIIVHRLDKMTAGLIILAHQRKTAAAFSQIFEQRKIKKCYKAIVEGIYTEANNEIILNSPVNDKQALSRVQLIESNESLNRSLLNVCIETGRKHQIRQHLANAGFPIVGDRLYGNDKTSEEVLEDLQLTACQLQFTCPNTGEEKNYQLKDKYWPKLNT